MRVDKDVAIVRGTRKQIAEKLRHLRIQREALLHKLQRSSKSRSDASK